MKYGVSRQQTEIPVGNASTHKAYQRANVVEWDAKWHALSAGARYYFLSEVHVPPRRNAAQSGSPIVSTLKFPPHVLTELVEAGFVEVIAGRAAGPPARVLAREGLYDFAARATSLAKFHLLLASKPSEFAKYVDYSFFDYQLRAVIASVLQNAGTIGYVQIDEAIKSYVTRWQWPRWAATALKDPLAARVIDVIEKADHPIPIAELPGLIPDQTPDQVRHAVERLITHLALVEDLQPNTWQVLVGLLPAVREDLIAAAKPRERPPLVIREKLRSVGPDDGPVVSDVRALLLEVASEAPRLRQDRSLFQNEIERFQTGREPLDLRLMSELGWNEDSRLMESIAWARTFQFVKDVMHGKQLRLQLTPAGQAWLSGGLDDQYTAFYEFASVLTARSAFGSGKAPQPNDEFSPFGGAGPGDFRFFGESVTARSATASQAVVYSSQSTPQERLALRRHVDRALSVLQPGVFYTLDSVAAHLAFGQYNPLNLGIDLEQVELTWRYRSIPALVDQREETARQFIESFVHLRLIPLGCFQAAVDENDQICIARQPRYDAYFGREVARPDPASTSKQATRVVVQPDFSVIVIGPNPAPAATLAPFCERTARTGGRGAIILKITRESVVKAVSNGLTPDEIVTRLQSHTSNSVPANVLKEVREWSNWVRRVSIATLTVMRCADTETADRALAALKGIAERISDTMIAVDQVKMSPATRAKLLSHGIIIERELGVPEYWND